MTAMKEFQHIILAVHANVYFVSLLIASLWSIHLLNWVLRYRLLILGVYPRHLLGLIGIPLAPFLHRDFNHLFFNSIPLFVLANLILLSGYNIFYCVTLLIVLISGLIVWVIGRKALHIGASGLIMGYFSFLLIEAYQQQTIMSAILAVVCIYYFGGLFLDLFPAEKEVSWESHSAGFVAGLAATYLCPYLQPLLAKWLVSVPTIYG